MVSKGQLIAFEERIAGIYEKGRIHAPIHLSKGNEDYLIDIFKDVKKDDWVFSTWRNHHHALLKGISEETLESEIIKGHSMHINSKENNFYSSSIVAGSLPIALGVAMALKRNGSNNRVWSFSGDMGSETGMFHEVTKYAFGHNLPITFVVEDDGFGVYTSTKKVWGRSSSFNNHGTIENHPSENLRSLGDSDNGPSIIKYTYNRGFESHGIGLFVDFENDEKLKQEFVEDHGKDYSDKLREAMTYLGNDKNTIFIGQTVGVRGSPIFNSLKEVSLEKRIELPVMEETQMGMSIGLALAGYTPVSAYPRFDFLTLASNQLVNHLDKAYELSNGEFNPKVIVRTAIGSKQPLYPGPQHCQDHTESYKMMLPNMEVIKLNHSSEIMPEYKRALERDKSTLLIEYV
ncbi:MAG: hypothetical protein IIA85_00055 [Nanoarchaeota archaeon]|nr:hypothetical protein [Nanoarchaeota archaeon]